MKKTKTKKIILIIVIIGILAAIYPAYLYFMPHRDVQETEAFASLSSKQLVDEYLKDNATANAKYLEKDGNSKVLIIEGLISSITKDQNDQTVMLLKDASEEAGVNCTFLIDAENRIKDLKLGDNIRVKGFITLGASYDEDLEMYEDVIMQDCDMVK